VPPRNTANNVPPAQSSALAPAPAAAKCWREPSIRAGAHPVRVPPASVICFNLCNLWRSFFSSHISQIFTDSVELRLAVGLRTPARALY